MSAVRKLISAWMLALVVSLLLPLATPAVVVSTTHDLLAETTTTPATTAEHTTTIATGANGFSLQRTAGHQALLGLNRLLLASPEYAGRVYGTQVTGLSNALIGMSGGEGKSAAYRTGYVGSQFAAIYLTGKYADKPINFKSAPKISNPVPSRMARVVPDTPITRASGTLGRPGASDVFVTAADDIAGMNASQISQRLTIPQSPTGYRVMEFSTPSSGVASPILRTDPGFIGGGRTLGGAREFVIPNGSIPYGANTTVIRP